MNDDDLDAANDKTQRSQELYEAKLMLKILTTLNKHGISLDTQNRVRREWTQ